MSTKIEELRETHARGLKVLKKFMKMSDSEIKSKVDSICGDKISDSDLILGEKSSVTRTIRDEEPEHIKIAYYDVVTISPFGINFEPEHGAAEKLASFGEHFKL